MGERVYNSAFTVGPGGRATRYDKRHLVPFGEYVPLAGVFSFVDKLARNAGDFATADRLVLLPWGRERIGMAICYEIVFPAEVAATVADGATLLATITNDAWYGDTAAPWQHYAAARFRAAENRRPLVRAAITGVSAVVAPDGRERARPGPLHPRGDRDRGGGAARPVALHPRPVAGAGRGDGGGGAGPGDRRRRGAGQEAFCSPAPIWWVSHASMNGSRSPSSTRSASPTSVPVRWSLTIR